MVEINARNNMATYQASLLERFSSADQTALARLYPLRLTEPLPFSGLRRRLDRLLFDPATGEGLLVNNFATVNADVARLSDPETVPGVVGRLYGLVIADSFERAAAIDRGVVARMAGLITTGSS
jgi:hypothetical protein